VREATSIDAVVIATSIKTADDAIEQFGIEHDVSIHRGSENNVQQRLFDAATAHDADILVRITADCPLIDPSTIDAVVSRAQKENVAYATNVFQRTFPRGLDVEAFSYESFEHVVSASTTQFEREHVTPYYRDNADEFEVENVASDAVFSGSQYVDRSDIRITLDEAADYRLLGRIYDEIEYTDTIPIREAIEYIDAEDLTELNADVEQK
jgi:spore coat polysaccharide biosynthesis protein SpsF